MSVNTSETTYEEGIKELGFNVYSWAIQVVVLFVLFIFGFIGNITVFILLIRKKLAISSTIRHLILNLVMADLFVVNFCILTLAIWHYTVEWLAGDFLCRFSKFMQMFSLYASTFIIVVISIDRCMAVVAPMCRLKVDRYGRRNSHKMVVVAWILAGVFSIPQAIIFKVQQAPTEIVFYQCVTFGSYTQSWQEPLYTSFTLCVNFLFPFVIIITCYTLILHRLSTSQRGNEDNPQTKLFSETSNDRNQSAVPCYSYVMEKTQFPANHHHWNYNISQRSAKLRKARATSLCLSVLIVLTFVICWGPYYARMVGAFIWEAATDENVDNVVFFFGMSNSVINPLIYGAFHVMGRTVSRGSGRETKHRLHSTVRSVPRMIQRLQSSACPDEALSLHYSHPPSLSPVHRVHAQPRPPAHAPSAPFPVSLRLSVQTNPLHKCRYKEALRPLNTGCCLVKEKSSSPENNRTN